MKLILMRHGEASYQFGAKDEERPLTAFGAAQARTAGLWLAAQGLQPDAVLCSTAKRTAQTLEHLRLGGLELPPGSMRSELYLATPQAMLSLIEAQVGKSDTLMLIAHNPGLSDLASELSDQRLHFSPASVSVLEFDPTGFDPARVLHVFQARPGA
jgi:phosphohistidine phosphatase